MPLKGGETSVLPNAGEEDRGGGTEKRVVGDGGRWWYLGWLNEPAEDRGVDRLLHHYPASSFRC